MSLPPVHILFHFKGSAKINQTCTPCVLLRAQEGGDRIQRGQDDLLTAGETPAYVPCYQLPVKGQSCPVGVGEPNLGPRASTRLGPLLLKGLTYCHIQVTSSGSRAGAGQMQGGEG